MNSKDTPSMSILEIVEEYLREHGYDGLYNNDMCGCLVDDLSPCCEGISVRCRPGWKRPTPVDNVWGEFWSVCGTKERHDDE